LFFQSQRWMTSCYYYRRERGGGWNRIILLLPCMIMYSIFLDYTKRKGNTTRLEKVDEGLE
jgi:hypothetical protein